MIFIMIICNRKTDVANLLVAGNIDKKGLYKGRDGEYEIEVTYIGWGWIVIGINGPNKSGPIIVKTLKRPIHKIINAFKNDETFG